ncbi:glutathione S-transferase family protein [Gammaproteobacteria bacterium AS21]
MLKFYFHQTPNPMKVALCLEELGLAYQLIPVDTLKGEQHTPEYRAINPNGKTPAIEDDGKCVFDSNAILMYLSQKTGRLAGKAEDNAQMLSWLMFVASGLGPFSGQAVHFRHAAPEQVPYAINRYLHEAKRHYQVLETHMQGREYIVGDEYTIADISVWAWLDKATVVLGEEGLDNYPNLQRWFASIDARPSVARARNVAKDIEFKSDFDEQAARSLYPQNFDNEV